MPITGRIMLIDLENVVGTNRKPAALRSLVTAFLDAAGPHHHTVAAYAVHSPDSKSVASVLTALGVAPLPVEPGPDAAENALIAHAVRMHREGCCRFTVASGDGAFTRLADATNARLDILVWKGQPIATRLSKIAGTVQRVPLPAKGVQAGSAPSGQAVARKGSDYTSTLVSSDPAARLSLFVSALLVGIGVALGQRLVDVALRRR
ncbi:hypothetical protein [Saccharothrix sp.]|uniref:hypothetical protein n=1 Tax=Saccharothrix sp. TaxID=1873460 RepID=UPI002810CE86|nr:hypothetical protein [Saccharothrix sp.]